jgi:hypothetical protein
MILDNKWLRITGTALVAGVAFVWIGRGFRLGIEPWQVAVVAGAGALGAWYRIRKGRDG